MNAVDHEVPGTRRNPAAAPKEEVVLGAQRSASLRLEKRLLDLTGALTLLVLFFPLLLVVAIIAYFDDGGPIIYRRRVVGPNGEFDAYKIRTMRKDADSILLRDPSLLAEYRRNFKLLNDPRVTRFGAVLRKLSIDELPQLVNVLCGDMSLVGPRMITAPELSKYGVHKELLLSCKPGLTGYWQVFGRQNVSYQERVRMDVHYLQNWSIRMDIALLLRTPLKVLKMEGAC
jgi:lipopolysaccharide/colanic/teichoic acid biosynthesis glycosyltransferase